ncbi:MAG: succinyl-diaminopimelate desuccinylase [Pseudomonadota bacterium]|jgi:succinyl-diaminopimelate desuccinylase
MKIETSVQLTRMLLQEDTCTGSFDTGFSRKLASWLESLGFAVESVEVAGIAHMAATIGPRDARMRLAFVGHYDTVGAGEGWRFPPFGAAEENGVLYGRGASDMKSGDAAMIFAAVQLVAQGVRSTVFLPGDEETSSRGMPALLDRFGSDFDYCICGEPTSKKKLGDCVKVGRRGVLGAAVSLLGKRGHTAYADITPNVVHALPSVITELAKPWNDACYGVSTTLSITTISTDSTAHNVIPGVVSFTFDMRFAPNRSVDEMKREVVSRLDAAGVSYEVAWQWETRPYVTGIGADPSSPQGKLIAVTQSVIEEMLGITPILSCDGGTSDARFVAWRGIPTIEFGVPHGNMHGTDEFVEVKNIDSLERVFVAIGEKLVTKAV